MTLATRKQVLFNPGPVNLHESIRSNLFNVELCHRQPEFDELEARVKAGLFSVAGLSPGSHHLSLLHGSGTLAVDAGLTSLVRGTVLVVDNGLYCGRMLRTLGPFPDARLVDHDLGIGRPVDLDALDRRLAELRPNWIAMVHHETTTGLLNPLSAIASLAERTGCRLFVDAVSSLGAHPIDPRADVVCFNGNKCLESLPGVAGVFWRRDLTAHPTVPVLDVSAYVDAMPSTPNVQAIVALDTALELFSSEDRPARYRRLAEHVWSSGSRYFEPLLAEPDRSHVLTSFRLGGRDPDDLFRRALDHGFVIYHGQRHLRQEIFRVANMGVAIDAAVIDELFAVLAS